jgi:HK97 gp10 family phage protein
VKVSGSVDARGLLGFLGELPKTVQQNVANVALMDAARVVVAAAKARAPVESGTLRRAIVPKLLRAKIKGQRTVLVGVQSRVMITEFGPRNPAKYAALVEFGTAPHEIKATKASVLSDGETIFGRTVIVSAPPRPFMRPAIDGNGGAVLKAISDGVGRGIEREGKRLARKHAKSP